MSERHLICIGCPLGCMLTATLENGAVTAVTGNTCRRGDEYARKECTTPERTVTGTVRVTGGSAGVVSVRTSSPIPKEKVMELALIENLQRQDLNPVEEALGYQTLMAEYGLTQEETAARVGKSRPNVANMLRLLALSPEVLDMVREGKLTAGHGRAIVALKTEKLQKEAAQKIAALGLSVRQAELLCKNLQKEPAPAKPVTLQVDYVAECEKKLSKQLGRGVKLVSGKKKGRLVLEYYGQDDLQTLLDVLMNTKK